MRKKVAKQLRKACGVEKDSRRNYVTHEVPKIMKILQFNGMTNQVSEVEKTVSCRIVENTDPERKLYKYYKRKYNDFNKEELVLNQLPTTEDLDGLTNKIIGQETVQPSNGDGTEEGVLSTT